MQTLEQEIGARLRSERLRLKLTLDECAGVGKVARSTQQNYEAGIRVPDLVYMTRLSAAGFDHHFVILGEHDHGSPFNWNLLEQVLRIVKRFEEENKISIPVDRICRFAMDMMSDASASEDPERTVSRALRLVA